MLAISLTIAFSRYKHNGVILHGHPVRGESHNQRNTTGEVATTSPPSYNQGCGVGVGRIFNLRSRSRRKF